MPAGRASVRPEGEEVNHDERRMPVSGLFCLDRVDGLLVVRLFRSLKEMNKETCIMKRPRRPSRLPLFYHFLFNVAFLSGVIAGSLSRTPVLTLLGAIGVLLLLNGIWFWTTRRYKDS
jgi:hypothetical protein